MALPRIVCVPIETDLYEELVIRRRLGDGGDPVLTINDILRGFIEDTAGDYRPPDRRRGVYWQNVFLPDGTRLRMTIRGTQHFAEVADEAVVHDGERLTPPSWANKIAGHPRNAWRDIYVMRPHDQEWVPADSLRRGQK